MKVDRERFAKEMALEEPMVRELYAVFAEELASDLNMLRQAHASGDPVSYASAVHKIKGTSASYLAGNLLACVSKADAQMKAGNPVAGMGMISEIEKMGKAVLQEIAAW